MLKLQLIEISNDDEINLFYVCLPNIKEGNILVQGTIDELFNYAQNMYSNSKVSTGDDNFVYTKIQNAELTDEDVWILCDPHSLENITDLKILLKKGFMKVMRNPRFANTKLAGTVHVGTLNECMMRLYQYLKKLENQIYGTND